MAIARVLRRQLESIRADVVQIDEANISGHPEDREWAMAAINHVLEGVTGERAVHVCFGNYGGQSVQKGFWKDLMPFFNGLKANHLVLEFARRGYDELDRRASLRAAQPAEEVERQLALVRKRVPLRLFRLTLRGWLQIIDDERRP